MANLKQVYEKPLSSLDKMGEERFVLLWALQQMDGVAAGGALDGARKEDIMMLE